MTNLCVRCEKLGDVGYLMMIVNPDHNGPEEIAVCNSCLILGDRIAGPLEIEFDYEEWGEDSDAESLEHGPR